MSLSIVIAGAAPDSTNLGVNALLLGLLEGLQSRCTIRPTVLGFGRRRQQRTYRLSGGSVGATLQGAVRTKWPLSGSNLLTAKWCASVIPSLHPLSRAVAHAEAVLDITGGDSFTDLYGQPRFEGAMLRKQLATRCSTGLILLPQTFGPFKSQRNLERAAVITRRAAQAWARDARSFEILKELLGDAFDPEKHRLGVDVAFLLPKAEPPEAKLPDGLRTALADGRPLVGVNISGLIYNDPAAARDRYGFRADYRELATALVRWLLEQDEADVVLVPHVLAPPGVAESDPAANEAVSRELVGVAGSRLHVLPPTLDASQTKWAISRCSWFCGTRMHATIAGLSSGVSTATINYSDKARGVFEGCGMGEAVVDPRQLDTQASLEAIQQVYLRREELGRKLAEGLPPVLRTAEWQMDEIATCIRGLADAGTGKASGL